MGKQSIVPANDPLFIGSQMSPHNPRCLTGQWDNGQATTMIKRRIGPAMLSALRLAIPNLPKALYDQELSGNSDIATAGIDDSKRLMWTPGN